MPGLGLLFEFQVLLLPAAASLCVNPGIALLDQCGVEVLAIDDDSHSLAFHALTRRDSKETPHKRQSP